MAMEKSQDKRPDKCAAKRSRGRPAGKTYDFTARIPMRRETWDALNALAAERGTTATAIVREAAERTVKRHR